MATACIEYKLDAKSIPRFGANVSRDEAERAEKQMVALRQEQQLVWEKEKILNSWGQTYGDFTLPVHPNSQMCIYEGVETMQCTPEHDVLYRGFVVDSRTHSVFETEPFVARSSEQARIKAFVLSEFDVDELDLFDIIIEQIGSVRRKTEVKVE